MSKPDFSGSFTDRWVKHVRSPMKEDRPNQWTFLEKLKRGRSLALLVSHGGSRTWRVIWYVDAKPQGAKLGSYPDMTVQLAREAADTFQPVKAMAAKAAGTFEEVTTEFIKRHVDSKGLRSKADIERHLNRYVLPSWKKRLLYEITRRDVNTLLNDIEDNHGKRQADVVLATVRKLMRWYQTTDDQYTSPIVPGMKRAEYKPRERWLTDDEIRLVWAASDHPDLWKPYGGMIKMALLTGQRRTKLATMRWDDVDLEMGVWTIQREAREKGAPAQITLPQTAIDVLKELKELATNDYVFPGRGKTAFNAFSQRKAEIDALLPEDMKSWTHHDLRRTCRKLMTRRHVETEIAERALGHSIKGIQAVYDDPREYEPRVNKALEAVASEIAVILKAAEATNVVPMGGRR